MTINTRREAHLPPFFAVAEEHWHQWLSFYKGQLHSFYRRQFIYVLTSAFGIHSCRPFRVPFTFCKLFLRLCIPSSSSSSSSLSQQLIVLHCHPLWATETHIHTKQGLYLIPNLPAVRHKLQLFAQKPRGWTADSSAASIKMHLQSCSFTCIDS